MNLKKIIFINLLTCCISFMNAQDNAIFNAIKKQNDVSLPLNKENALADSLNNNKVMFVPKEDVLNNDDPDRWFIALGYGLTEFRGDIKSEGFLNSNNINTTYNLRFGRLINHMFSISSNIIFGKLSGLREQESYVVSQTQSTAPHDPYSFYKGEGEKFLADFLEAELTASINLESLLAHYYKGYSDNNKINVFYNLGVGVLSFKSIKRNKNSGSYIYGFGYNDLEEKYEEELGFFKRPKARVLSFGYRISYPITQHIHSTLMWIRKIPDSDFMDSSFMNQDNDKYRCILLGVDYNF